MSGSLNTWQSVAVPELATLPRAVVVRAESLPPAHGFPEHTHAWHQLVYAISGVLVVAAANRWFVVPPEQAVWIPTGMAHRAGSHFGAEFRSLYVSQQAGQTMPATCTVLDVSPFLRALIVEAADMEARQEDDAYTGLVHGLILAQLQRMPVRRFCLPWPRDRMLQQICETLHAAPNDPRGPEEWATQLGSSARTLARRFERELGMGLREWRRRLRLLKAVEMLENGLSVTETALELGYASTSAFTYMFRREMGHSPRAQFRQMAA